MVAEARERLSEAVEQMEGEGVVILPDEVCLRLSRTEVLMAAGLADEEDTPLLRASRAMRAAEETGDEDMIATAEAHYDRELQCLIEENGLAPVVEELQSLLFTRDPEQAAGL